MGQIKIILFVILAFLSTLFYSADYVFFDNVRGVTTYVDIVNYTASEDYSSIDLYLKFTKNSEKAFVFTISGGNSVYTMKTVEAIGCSSPNTLDIDRDYKAYSGYTWRIFSDCDSLLIKIRFESSFNLDFFSSKDDIYIYFDEYKDKITVPGLAYGSGDKNNSGVIIVYSKNFLKTFNYEGNEDFMLGQLDEYLAKTKGAMELEGYDVVLLTDENFSSLRSCQINGKNTQVPCEHFNKFVIPIKNKIDEVALEMHSKGIPYENIYILFIGDIFPVALDNPAYGIRGEGQYLLSDVPYADVDGDFTTQEMNFGRIPGRRNADKWPDGNTLVDNLKLLYKLHMNRNRFSYMYRIAGKTSEEVCKVAEQEKVLFLHKPDLYSEGYVHFVYSNDLHSVYNPLFMRFKEDFGLRNMRSYLASAPDPEVLQVLSNDKLDDLTLAYSNIFLHSDSDSIYYYYFSDTKKGEGKAVEPTQLIYNKNIIYLHPCFGGAHIFFSRGLVQGYYGEPSHVELIFAMSREGTALPFVIGSYGLVWNIRNELFGSTFLAYELTNQLLNGESVGSSLRKSKKSMLEHNETIFEYLKYETSGLFDEAIKRRNDIKKKMAMEFTFYGDPTFVPVERCDKMQFQR